MENRRKRQLKRKLAKKEQKVSLGKNLSLVIFAVSLLIFFATQVVTNSILTPLGAKLRAYNEEKEHLVEDNRILEEEIAETKSLTVIEHMTKKKFALDGNNSNHIVYISDDTIRAER